MTQELATFLKKAADHCGLEGVKINPAYSGRGMMGRTTHAITTSELSGGLGNLLMCALSYIKDMCEEGQSPVDPAEFCSHLPDFAEEGNLRQDSFGYGVVVY